MESTRLVDCARYVCQRGGGGEDFAVTGELGARFIPGETLPARPTQLFFPPSPLPVSREKRIDGSGFRCGTVIYLGGFLFFFIFQTDLFFTFRTTIPSNLNAEFLRRQLSRQGLTEGKN